MPLRDGTVDDLIEKGLYVHEVALADVLLEQMLDALAYIASYGIIHRDIKPGNILYLNEPAGSKQSYLYQLADFGLCNADAAAQSRAGTNGFMAPEVDRNPTQQTTKADIWSLFVTIAYALNV